MLGMTGHARTWVVASALGLCWLMAGTSEAQSTMPVVDEWAAAMANITARRWGGRRVDPPLERERPEGALLLARSRLRPLALHGPADTPLEEADALLETLEECFDLLVAAGWGPLPSDGGRGGTHAFDLYLVREGAPEARAWSDAIITYAYLDTASVFATLPAGLEGEEMRIATLQALTDAILLAWDPAEAAAWRRATVAWVTYQLTGRLDEGGGVDRQQREPWRSWVAGAGGRGEGGALLLHLLSEREDGGSGEFPRELWQLARQRTWEGERLRAAPDLWMALNRLVELSGEELHDVITSFAVQRWLDLPERLGVPRPPLFWESEWARLPHRSSPVEEPLEPFGSAYAMVDVSDAPDGARLRIWLKGEFGVAWGLTAVRLDSEGRELGRVSAPPRRDVPRSYIPLELNPGTARVLLVATNLSSRLPDADDGDENLRALHFVIDRATD